MSDRDAGARWGTKGADTPSAGHEGRSGSWRSGSWRSVWRWGRRLGALVAAVAVVVAAACAEELPVTQPSSLTVDPPFRYPVELWDAGLEGETVIMVHVTRRGGVDSVYVLEESGESAFDSAAVAGAYELRFAPGRRGDERVAMWVRLPVRFSRTDSEEGNGV